MLEITDQNRKWWILVAMGACGGLIMLDETVVALALPTMRGDLGMSEVASHWVISIYTLIFTGTAAASGNIGDVVGFGTLLLVASALFGLASLAVGLPTMGRSRSRSVRSRGLGAAAIFPATVAMVRIVFPEAQRGNATGILAAVGTSFLAPARSSAVSSPRRFPGVGYSGSTSRSSWPSPRSSLRPGRQAAGRRDRSLRLWRAGGAGDRAYRTGVCDHAGRQLGVD